jgi:hypothetical protein
MQATRIYCSIVTTMSTASRHPIFFDSPARYEIRALGRVDPNWADRLEGMKISETTPDGGPAITTLYGELIDQAALAGVLDTLYELQLTILSVVRSVDIG